MHNVKLWKYFLPHDMCDGMFFCTQGTVSLIRSSAKKKDFDVHFMDAGHAHDFIV